MVREIDHEEVLVSLFTKELPTEERSPKNAPLLAAKRAFLEQQILYDEVTDIVLNLDPDTPEQDGNVEDNSLFWEPLSNLLASAEVRETLQVDSDEEVDKPTILGMDSERWDQLSHRTAVDQVPPELHQLLLNEVEHRFFKKCQFLSHCVYGQKAGTDPKLDAAKARGLATIAQARIKRINEKKKEAMATRIRLACAFKSYFEKWWKLMQNLWTVIVRYKCQLEPEKRAALEDYFSAIIDNIYLKMRCLKAEVTLSMAEGDQASVLRQTRTSLDAVKSRLAERLREVDIQLQQYEHVGDEFARIVKTYSAIMRDIATVEEDIRQISTESGGL
ncbi:hypothetical protein SpCBS45565_g00334 [Spizellomyces sp. 'palustris']|nr:hypothetical protein SpCBS45565_g00334 [Spizellomyces sp. 'palustris']